MNKFYGKNFIVEYMHPVAVIRLSKRPSFDEFTAALGQLEKEIVKDKQKIFIIHSEQRENDFLIVIIFEF